MAGVRSFIYQMSWLPAGMLFNFMTKNSPPSASSVGGVSKSIAVFMEML
jgi:hypothetical protein